MNISENNKKINLINLLKAVSDNYRIDNIYGTMEFNFGCNNELIELNNIHSNIFRNIKIFQYTPHDPSDNNPELNDKLVMTFPNFEDKINYSDEKYEDDLYDKLKKALPNATIYTDDGIYEIYLKLDDLESLSIKYLEAITNEWDEWFDKTVKFNIFKYNGFYYATESTILKDTGVEDGSIE